MNLSKWLSNPAVVTEPKLKRVWSGQGFCEQCGSKLEKVEGRDRRTFNPFTGEKAGDPITVLYCPRIVQSSMIPGGGWGEFETAPYTASELVFRRNHKYDRHDYWFVS